MVRQFRRAFYLLLFIVLRPVGTVPVRLEGVWAKFNYRSISDFRRAVGIGGERRILAAVLAEIPFGSSVWDIGANVGTHTVYFSKRVGSSGTVLAFEPVPLVQGFLEDNLELNSLTNVKICRYAVGVANSTESFYIDPDDASGKHSAIYNETYSATSLKFVKGEDILRVENTPIPYFVKIDVEGFEISVLEGLGSILNDEGCVLLLCEVHNLGGDNSVSELDDVKAILSSAGFNSFSETPRGSQVHLFARKTS